VPVDTTLTFGCGGVGLNAILLIVPAKSAHTDFRILARQQYGDPGTITANGLAEDWRFPTTGASPPENFVSYESPSAETRACQKQDNGL
jgi:hypothetical protein